MKSYEIINNNAEKIASAINDSLGTIERPSVVALIKWIEENFGLKMEVRHFYSDELKQSGLVYYDPGINKYAVWINGRECESRQLFTLCHELGHIIRNSGRAFGFSDGEIYSKRGEERFCDRFAAAFLMPRDIFIQKWKSNKENLTFKKVSMTGIFKVSGMAVYYRAKELGLLND